MITLETILNEMLQKREYSVKQAHELLTKKGYPSSVVDQLLARYIKCGWLSDDRYIKITVQRLMERGYGPYYVQQVLRQRQLEIEVKDFDWDEAYRVAARKAGNRQGIKLKQYLYRRGFTNEFEDD